MRRQTVSFLRSSFLVLVLGALLALVPAASAAAGELTIETENDFLTQHQTDDIYTFSLAFAWDWKDHGIRLRENAFTDRHAHLRFDETYLTTGRDLKIGRHGRATIEGGLVHVGRGLFGERTQNSVHELIGDPLVHLRYIDTPRFHPYGSLHSEWTVAQGRRVISGPVLELETAPGFKSTAVAAWKAEWNPPGPFGFEATAGVKWAHTALGALAPWTHARAPYGDLEVLFHRHFVLSWSYNGYGTGREHLAIGYRFSDRRRWSPAGSASRRQAPPLAHHG